MTDLRQTPEYAIYLESIGWIVERKAGVNYFIRKFPLIGSVIKIQRPRILNYQYIDVLVVKYRTFQIVIEPKNKTQEQNLRKKGYKMNKSPFLPAKTIHIDLKKPIDRLLKEMHYKTRYNIKTHNSQLITHNSKDILSFADFWQACALKQRGVYLPQKKEIIELFKAFRENAKILTVQKGKEIMSGVLLIKADKIAYYMYAASSKNGKKLFAPTINAWEAIRQAKKLKCEIFDFEGIYDERFPLKSWKGFTRFKKSFGGKIVEYPGTFVKNIFPF